MRIASLYISFLVVVSAFFSCVKKVLINTVTYSEPVALTCKDSLSFLVDKNWEIYKAVERFNGQVTIMTDSVNETIYDTNNPAIVYQRIWGDWEQFPRFNSDSTFKYTFYSDRHHDGKWQYRNGFIYIQPDSLRPGRKDFVFRDEMKIIYCSDSTIILKRYIDRYNQWTRTFYLTRRE